MPRIEQVVAVWGSAGSWVDLDDCDVLLFSSLVVVVLSMSACLGCVGYHNRSSHVVLRTTAEQNTDTMRTVRNIADKCGQMRKIADKSRTNANMRE